jgi:fibronectin type 3 domain-containing protein
MKQAIVFTVVMLFLAGLAATAQTCPAAPTPGAPHACLKWTDSTTAGATYNVYRATTSGAENYGTPLNAAPLAAGSIAYYDATVAIGTTYYYTLAAVGTGGVLSTPTSEVSVLIPVPPNAPTSVTVSTD